jgi:hypothetical protein
MPAVAGHEQKPPATFSAIRWHGPPHAQPSQLQPPKQLPTAHVSPQPPPLPKSLPSGRLAFRVSSGRGARFEVATWQASPHPGPNSPLETHPVADRHTRAANAMHCFIENPPCESPSPAHEDRRQVRPNLTNTRAVRPRGMARTRVAPTRTTGIGGRIRRVQQKELRSTAAAY